VPRKPKTETAAQQPARTQTTAAPPPAAAAPAPIKPASASAPATATGKAADDKPKQDNGGAQIVRLDAFRKK
jgi:hypothetical protein